MSKVITFSRTFPAYHARKGEPTFFVEKFWKSLYDQPQFSLAYFTPYEDAYTKVFPLKFIPEENLEFHSGKHHTIRAGKRWKVGDRFSPRVWSGKPYNSKQIVIAPDVEIKKVWDFVLWDNGKHIEIKIDNRSFDGFEIIEELYALMHNDGLTPDDFRYWFISSPDFKKKKRFEGQIICWNENIIY